MLLDKNNIESAIMSYTLDGYSMTAKAWTYENKATIFVLDKDVKYNQDFYYVLKGGIPNAGVTIESLNAEVFSNPFDAYAKFQDLLNEGDPQSPPPPTPPEDQKIPIILKNKKTNECQIREVNGNLEVGSDILGEAFIGEPNKVNLKSEDVIETQLFVNGEGMDVILLKAKKLDTDGKDAYFVIPKQPNSQSPQENESEDESQKDESQKDESQKDKTQKQEKKPKSAKKEKEEGDGEEGDDGDDGEDGEGDDGEGEGEEGNDGEDGEGDDGEGEGEEGDDGDDGESEDGDEGEGEDGAGDGEGEDGEDSDEDGEGEGEGEGEDGEQTDDQTDEGEATGGIGDGEPPEIQNEVLSDRVRIISEVSGIDQDIVKNNFRNVNLAVNFLSGINFKELQNRLNTDKTAYQLAQEVAQEIRNS
jgi:hypothetical protein